MSPPRRPRAARSPRSARATRSPSTSTTAASTLPSPTRRSPSESPITSRRSPPSHTASCRSTPPPSPQPPRARSPSPSGACLATFPPPRVEKPPPMPSADNRVVLPRSQRLRGVDELFDQGVEALRPLQHRQVAGPLEDLEARAGDQAVVPERRFDRDDLVVQPPDDEGRDFDLGQPLAGVVAPDRRQRVAESQRPQARVPLLGQELGPQLVGVAEEPAEGELPPPRPGQPGATVARQQRPRRLDRP